MDAQHTQGIHSEANKEPEQTKRGLQSKLRSVICMFLSHSLANQESIHFHS